MLDVVTFRPPLTYPLVKRGAIMTRAGTTTNIGMQMKTNLTKPILCACGLLAASLSAISSPLQRADIPGEPVWVAHLDCDALRPTAIGQYILSEMDKPEARAKLAAFKTIFDFDPRKQLHGLTLYATGKAPEDGVLLVYADVDPGRLETLAKAATDHQSTTYKDHTIHSWIDEKKKARHGVKPRVYAAVEGTRLVVFAQQEVRVAQALDVLNHAAPNLAGSKLFEQLGTAGSGTFIQAAARKMDLPEGTPNAALLRLAKMARLDMAEADGKLRATLKLEAEDDTVAKEMATVGQGLIALMKLQKDNPGSTKLAEALSLKQDDSGLVASLAIPNTEVIELMKADAARKAERKAKAESE
jgi:hypothetical protein